MSERTAVVRYRTTVGRETFDGDAVAAVEQTLDAFGGNGWQRAK